MDWDADPGEACFHSRQAPSLRPTIPATCQGRAKGGPRTAKDWPRRANRESREGPTCCAMLPHAAPCCLASGAVPAGACAAPVAARKEPRLRAMNGPWQGSQGQALHASHPLALSHHALACLHPLHPPPQAPSFRAETGLKTEIPKNPQRPGAAWPIGSKHEPGSGQASPKHAPRLGDGTDGSVRFRRWLVDDATGDGDAVWDGQVLGDRDGYQPVQAAWSGGPLTLAVLRARKKRLDSGTSHQLYISPWAH